jgi:hypothetical protein
MLPYWIIFGTIATAALARPRLDKSVWWLIGFILIFFIGLRYRVGGDWGTYRSQVWNMRDVPLIDVLLGRDPAYQLLNWIAAWLDADVWLVNIVCAFVLVGGLLRFIRRLPEPLLALTAATPYLLFIVGMGYARQAAAIGALLFAVSYFEQRRLLAFVLMSVLAASFHQTALLLLGPAALAYARRGFFTFVTLCVVTVVMYQVFLAERADRYIYGYVESSYAYASRGGFIRVLMTAVAGAAFILFFRRMKLAAHVRAFWFWTSLMSFAFLALVTSAPTAIDRMGLYILPLQVFVAGHLCLVFRSNERPLMRFAVVSLYFAALSVWLFLADHRGSWLPYQNWAFILQ